MVVRAWITGVRASCGNGQPWKRGSAGERAPISGNDDGRTIPGIRGGMGGMSNGRAWEDGGTVGGGRRKSVGRWRNGGLIMVNPGRLRLAKVA